MHDSPRVIGRIVAVDYGTKRIGLATTDVEQRIAVPADLLMATGDLRQDARMVLRWLAENDACRVVIGLPYNMDGTCGPQALLTQQFAGALKALDPRLAVEFWDERLSSFQADEWLEAAGERKKRGKRSPLRDALAATAILRSFLASRGDGPENSVEKR